MRACGDGPALRACGDGRQAIGDAEHRGQQVGFLERDHDRAGDALDVGADEQEPGRIADIVEQSLDGRGSRRGEGLCQGDRVPGAAGRTNRVQRAHGLLAQDPRVDGDLGGPRAGLHRTMESLRAEAELAFDRHQAHLARPPPRQGNFARAGVARQRHQLLVLDVDALDLGLEGTGEPDGGLERHETRRARAGVNDDTPLGFGRFCNVNHGMPPARFTYILQGHLKAICKALQGRLQDLHRAPILQTTGLMTFNRIRIGPGRWMSSHRRRRHCGVRTCERARQTPATYPRPTD